MKKPLLLFRAGDIYSDMKSIRAILDEERPLKEVSNSLGISIDAFSNKIHSALWRLVNYDQRKENLLTEKARKGASSLWLSARKSKHEWITAIDFYLTDKAQEFTMVQPNNVEEVLLGIMMLDPQICLKLSSIILPEKFTNTQCRIIYQAILRVMQSSEHVDLRTVVKSLKENSQLEIVGGAPYVVALTSYEKSKTPAAGEGR